MSRTIAVITPEQFQEYERQWNHPPVPAAVGVDQNLNGEAVTEAHKQRTNAAYWVAHCYNHGQGGVEEDRDEARRILEQVIDEQDSDNHNDNTGKHRERLAWQVGDPTRHNELFHQAVPRLEAEVQEGGNDLNFQEAAFLLGGCLYLGCGVGSDRPRAIHWWKIAAELGHMGAQINLCDGCCTVEEVNSLVIEWVKQQANAPHEYHWAQTALGKCYSKGRGVEKDLVKSVMWCNKAIAQGDDNATSFKQSLLRRLSPGEQNKTLGCVTRNQNIEKAEQLIEPPEPRSVPLGLWAHAMATFQHQEHPPWESPSPTFLALSRGITPQLQDQSSNRKRTLPNKD